MTFAGTTVTDLQKRLMRSILDHIREAGLEEGTTLNQLALAERFGVSRTPVRAALQQLHELGAVCIGENGVVVTDANCAPPDDPIVDPIEEIVFTISRDRHNGLIGTDVTENDLIRRYGVSRSQVVAALRRMASLGMVARKPGFGWRFEPLESREARFEGYRLRLLVEPAAILEPGFAPDPAWLQDIRSRHVEFLKRSWRDEFAVPLFDMNAEFHETLAEASNNRYLAQVVRQQIDLRRLRNYSWRLPSSRVLDSTNDHVGVLDALLDGDRAAASELMRRHIDSTMSVAL